jgi:biotin synthase
MSTFLELKSLYDLPLAELVLRAADVHRANRGHNDVQRCALLSIKTGGCPEDCGYCSQSAHYDSPVDRMPLMTVAEVREKAEQAKATGATRFCMGAAWRQPKDGPEFDRVLEMVGTVRELGMEACVTLGMLSPSQAKRLKEAGLTAYNHNLDTSREFYPNIVTTRKYDDRLNTLRNVSDAGISVCSGAIVGMGETIDDRLKMLAELGALTTPPESVPINCLMPQRGTPLQMAPAVDSFDFVRLVAVTRITFPKARVRLSAGRDQMSKELQFLCFLAGADSVFYGDKLLTATNPSVTQDAELFRAIGLPEPGSLVECAS